MVLAINIAETSLTTEGTHLAMDCVQGHVIRSDPRTGSTRLIIQRVSQVPMTQRAGHTGRPEPGICLHLAIKEQAGRVAAQNKPEILQNDLSGLSMELLQWGCSDSAQMNWLDQLSVVNLLATRRLLQMLGALEGERLSV